MNDASATEIGAWVTAAGLAGAAEPELLRGFCERAAAAGVPLARASSSSTPCTRSTRAAPFAGAATRRTSGSSSSTGARARTARPPRAGAAARSTICSRPAGRLLRRNLARGDPADFPRIEESARARRDRLSGARSIASPRTGVIGEMDCVYSSWTTDAPGGLRRRAGRGATQARSRPGAGDQMRLARPDRRHAGRDLSRPRRRPAGLERPHRCAASPNGSAPCCGSPTCAATPGSPTRPPPEQIIPLLNDYAEAVISAIHEAGGDVLKLIGDGTLAIFQADDPAQACRCALEAEAPARRADRGAQRAPRRGRAAGHPSSISALHIGEVFYGNIGSQDRLDFTVVGPAVNEVEPDRRDVPLGRARRAALLGLRRGGRTAASARRWSRSAATRCAASGGRRSCSRWSGRSAVSIAAGEPVWARRYSCERPAHAAGESRGRGHPPLARLI